jgi:hypothetical protein
MDGLRFKFEVLIKARIECVVPLLGIVDVSSANHFFGLSLRLQRTTPLRGALCSANQSTDPPSTRTHFLRAVARTDIARKVRVREVLAYRPRATDGSIQKCSGPVLGRARRGFRGWGMILGVDHSAKNTYPMTMQETFPFSSK